MALSISLNRARANITEAGVPLSTLAICCGLRPTSLSSAYRGLMSLDSEKEARLLTISFRLLELKQALMPLQFPTDAGDVVRLLDQLESGRVTLEQIHEMVEKLFGN